MAGHGSHLGNQPGNVLFSCVCEKIESGCYICDLLTMSQWAVPDHGPLGQLHVEPHTLGKGS